MSDDLFEDFTFPYPEIKEFLAFSYEDRLNARRTLELKIEILSAFCTYMAVEQKVRELKAITKDQLQTWMDRLVQEKGYAHSTIALHTATVFQLWRWCIARGYHDPEEIPLLRMSTFKFLGKPPREKRIVSPEEIFKVRTSGYGALSQATLFEILLCAGDRMGSVLQLRANDITWGSFPNDKELQLPSPYVAATVQLQPETHAIKQRRPRKFFLSKIAAKLLLLWMEERRIPIDSNLPLFPFNKGNGWRMMNSLAQRTKMNVTSLDFRTEEDSKYDVDQMYALEDIRLEEVDDDMLRMMIVRSRKQEARKRKLLRMGPVGRKKDIKRFSRRTSAMNPHLMRYTCVCLMWYRTFTGERQNEFAVQTYIGHAINKILRRYLVETDFVKNDYIWKALWLGKPDHWRHLISGDRLSRTNQGHMTGYKRRWGQEPINPVQGES